MRDVTALSLLLDYYGVFLTDNQRELIELSCDEDLSLSEIAERRGVSRQGVRDAITRGTKLLEDMESKLHLIERDGIMLEQIGEIGELLANVSRSADENTARELGLIKKLLSDLSDILEG